MSTDALNILIKKRACIKGSLTRFKKFVESIDVNTTDLNIIKEVHLRTSKIDTIIDEFNSIQIEIEILDTSEDVSHHEAERHLFEDTYYALKSIAAAIMDQPVSIANAVCIAIVA